MEQEILEAEVIVTDDGAQITESTTANFEQLSCEKVQDLYWGGQLMKPEFQLYRLVTHNGRIYFRFQDEKNFKNPILYFGATSISDEKPQSEQLIEWRIKAGLDYTKRYLWMRTLYGSHIHTVIANYVKTGEVNLRELPANLRKYFYENSFYCTEQELKSMGVEIQKDLISFRRFVQDYNVEFIAIEMPCFSDIDGCASQIDHLVWMDYRRTKKDTLKRIPAIIDYKSTKKTHRADMAYQLFSYKNMLHEMYPDLDVNGLKLFNLSATAWKSFKWDGKTKPYRLTDQTGRCDEKRYSHYLDLAKMTAQQKFGRSVSFIDGSMKLTDEPTGFIKSKTIREVIEQGDWQGLFGNQEVDLLNTENA
jgi:hypothetical protein